VSGKSSCQVRAADFISFVAVRRDGDRPQLSSNALSFPMNLAIQSESLHNQSTGAVIRRQQAIASSR
jgi:hypothetical protein